MTDESFPAGRCADTGFLKIIAAAAMLIDHTGAVLFPGEILWRVVGRISWPLFAYCLVVGFMRTRSLKKYAGRIAVFGLVSQPFYLFALYPDTLGTIFSGGAGLDTLWTQARLDIFFTLLLGLLALYGLRRAKYGFTLAALILSLAPCVSYGIMGVLLIILIWLLMKTRAELFAACLALFLCSYFLMPPYNLLLSGVGINIQGFSALSVPLMCMRNHDGWRPPKYFYYVFYPAHLLVLALMRLYII